MSTKSKQIFIISAIILVLALAAAVIFFGRTDEENYEKALAEAEKYLDACDYDNAVAIYNRVIADDHKCAEAYAGLADAYFAKNRRDKALEVLEKGAENTDENEMILNKMDELFPNLNYAEENTESEELSEKMVSETEVAAEVTEPQTTETTSVEASETASETVETTLTESTVTTVPTTVTTTAPTTVATTAPTTAAATAPTTARTTATTTTAATTSKTTVTTTSAETEELIFVEIPDFTLMTLDDAYSWCSMNNLYLKVIGSGEKPLSQSPAPGTSVEENSDIIVKCGE